MHSCSAYISTKIQNQCIKLLSPFISTASAVLVAPLYFPLLFLLLLGHEMQPDALRGSNKLSVRLSCICSASADAQSLRSEYSDTLE